MKKRLIRIHLLLLIIFSLFFSQTPALAQTYPWREVHPNQFKIVEDAVIENKLKLKLVSNAIHTIDVIDYDIGGDALLAQPFLEQLVRASQRGVRVRFLRGGYLPHLYRKLWREPHWRDPVESILLRGSQMNPVQYVFFGGTPMFLNGWSLFAGAHEKLLIIDQQIVLMTGRGLSRAYLNYIDHCILFKGPVVGDTIQAFENLWRVIHEEVSKTQPSSIASAAMRPDRLTTASPQTLALSLKQKKKITKLWRWILQPAAELHEDNQREAIQARLIHHDLIDQMRRVCPSVPWIYGMLDCSSRIQDPFIQELSDLILGGAKEVKFYTLGGSMHENLKLALKSRLREAELRRRTGVGRDFRLEVFTNGKDAYQEFVFWPASLLGWHASLKDIDELIQEGASIHAFERNAESHLNYTHRKGVIVKMIDGAEYSFFGSHNMNQTSSGLNDEMGLQIRSKQMTHQYDELFRKAVDHHSTELDARDIQRQRWWHKLPLIGWESYPLKWVLKIVESAL